MKRLLICALIAFAQPAAADWYFEASLEGGAEWVEVSFGADSHKFSLAGSTKALDDIKVYLH